MEVYLAFGYKYIYITKHKTKGLQNNPDLYVENGEGVVGDGVHYCCISIGKICSLMYAMHAYICVCEYECVEDGSLPKGNGDFVLYFRQGFNNIFIQCFERALKTIRF